MNVLLLGTAVLCLTWPALLIRFAAAPNEAIGFWRLLAVCVLLGPSAWRGRGAWLALPGAERAWTAAAGALFFAHLWCFTYAAQHTTVARTMVAFSTHPVWTGLGAWLLYKETLTRRVLLAYALAAVGVVCLFWGRVEPARAAGDAVAVLSALTFSGYVLAAKGLRRRLPNALFASLCSLVVAALFLALAAAKGTPLTGYPPRFWAAVLALAAVVSVGGHALFTHLLASMDVRALSLAKLLEPVGAAAWAWLLLGEPAGAGALAAFVLIASSVGLLLI